jgi:hypothetical protein
MPEGSQRGPDLAQAGLRDPLQAINPPLPPPIDLRRRKPAQPDEHVDRADELLLGEHRLG